MIADMLVLAQLHEIVRGHAEPQVLAFDRVVNDRGIAFDAELAHAVIELEAHETRIASEKVERETYGEIKAGDLHKDQRIQKWLRLHGVDLPDLQYATLQKTLQERSDLEPVVRLVLEARRSVNRVTAPKLEHGIATCELDGRLRDLLVYHQARTGRWAGRGAQPHNLPRPHHDLQDLAPLVAAISAPEKFRKLLPPTVTTADAYSALIRLCYRAGPGAMLLLGDFASIEARAVAWCANETNLLRLFATGGDAYCDFATRIFGRAITKEMKRERAVGKQAVLGCGFGMGPDRFAETCATHGVDLQAAGVDAQFIVNAYRTAYPRIAGGVIAGCAFPSSGLWRNVETAARQAVEEGRCSTAGRCEFSRERDALVIKLPSGRKIYYHNARIEERVPSYCASLGVPAFEKPTLVYDGPTEKDQGTTTYGGKLTENIASGISRDLLVAAMLECERRELPVVLHVHDESVVEVAADGADVRLCELLTIMSTPPPWADGFPLEVEGFCSTRYTKHPPQGAVVLKARNGVILD
jgi:DNA polymerase